MRTSTSLFWVGCLALAGCVGQIGGPDGAGDPTNLDPTKNPTSTSAFSCDPSASAIASSPIKRLAKTYLVNAVTELLSPLSDAQRTAVLAAIQTRLDLVPTDDGTTYAENDNTVSQDHVDAIFGLAVALSQKLADKTAPYDAALLAPCGQNQARSALDQPACLESFVKYYGRKTFRRPLEDAELKDFEQFYADARAKNVDGMAALFARFVAHPRFYCRFDLDGTLAQGTEGQDATYTLTRWELLSKITFLFWAAPPTDALLDRVAQKDPTNDAELASLVDDVLADPKSERGVGSFYREWLALDKAKMPATDGNVAASQAMIKAAGIDALPSTHREDMIQEVLDLAKHYSLATNGKLDDILTSDVSFAKTDALAKIYGVAPWDGAADHLVKLPAGPRTGLLTRAALVATNTEYTRPILKGKEVRTRLLCTPVPLPPPNLDIKPLTHPVNKTTREATEEATSNPTCNGCHGKMNPFGFASENFDPIGRARDTELRFQDKSGDILAHLPIDTRVSIDFGDGNSKDAADIKELSQQIADSGVAHTCMVRSFFEFVTGRQEDDKADGCDLKAMRDRLTAGDGSIKSMLKERVLQTSFRSRKVQ